MEISATQENIEEIAEAVLKLKEDLTIIAFRGELGAGKTTLIQSICKSLGVDEPVSSPTFSLVNEYRAANGKKIYHFDFYRLNSPGEAFEIGIDEYFDSGALCLIEWPEMLADIMPEEHLSVTIKNEGNGSRNYSIETP
ncbi:MAG: tRNA (adenosine(37)-N6)-threonylcarbamoyltransferase complex ATPase subunit type 1 TsaE [Bacteroidia bacterium]|nr:tRNA (adenosine(37)-N6)-threonylcarbamoyltransferase complex ATPase subunit type 1 TsaE [Bacteroidia bacterium]